MVKPSAAERTIPMFEDPPKRRPNRLTHGHTVGKRFSSEYTSWWGMVQRCTNPNADNYARYGGDGVSVCARWLESFEAFLADMGPRPSRAHTLDRFPNGAGNYEPGNVRWATAEEQANNRSSNRLIEFNGETLTIAQWARKTGMAYARLAARVLRGWPPHLALDPKATRRDKMAFDGKLRAPKAWPTLKCTVCGESFTARSTRSRQCGRRCQKIEARRASYARHRDRICAERRAAARAGRTA